MITLNYALSTVALAAGLYTLLVVTVTALLYSLFCRRPTVTRLKVQHVDGRTRFLQCGSIDIYTKGTLNRKRVYTGLQDLRDDKRVIYRSIKLYSGEVELYWSGEATLVLNDSLEESTWNIATSTGDTISDKRSCCVRGDQPL